MVVHTIHRKTVVGKFLQDVFGFSASYDREFNSKRRVKLKFQSPNYLLFSYIRVEVEMQKKNWIGWSETDCEELRLGWDGIHYKFNNPIPMNSMIKPTKLNPNSWLYGSLQPPASKKTYLTIYISDFEFSFTSKEVAKIFKVGFDWVRKQLSAPNKSSDIAILTNPNEIFVSEEHFSKSNGSSIAKTFDFSVGLFVFKWNMNSPVDVGNFSLKSMGFDIKTASIYGMAKYDGRWLGVRIEKY
jgi:hypothetical protein